ncbi:MAG TPA: YbjN domain-containing protein, partial [Microvirga sp.]|nr:YbjN domain-containing protein [Microvirga sp.]
MPQLHIEIDRMEHPLDVVERLASLRDWIFDRAETDEMSVSVSGSWADYHIAFTWIEDVEALHVACAFDLKVPERRRQEVLQLLSYINEQLWVGHFDLWSSENVVMFRNALLL